MAENVWVGKVGFMVKGGRYFVNYTVRPRGTTRTAVVQRAVAEAEKLLKQDRPRTKVTEISVHLTMLKNTTSGTEDD